MTASNIFSSTIRALRANTHLKKVILFKQPQARANDASLRSRLAYLFNQTIYDLWLKSPFKHSIILANDSFDVDQVTNSIIKLSSLAFQLRRECSRDTDIRKNSPRTYEWNDAHPRNKTQRIVRNENSEIPTQNRFEVLGNLKRGENLPRC